MRPLWATGLGIAVLVVVLVFSLRSLARKNGQTLEQRQRIETEHPKSDVDMPRRGTD